MRKSFPISNRIIETDAWKALSNASKVLYTILCKVSHTYGDVNGWFFRSARDLSNDTALNKDTISRCLKELKQAGLIELKSPDTLNKGQASFINLVDYSELDKIKLPKRKKKYVCKKHT